MFDPGGMTSERYRLLSKWRSYFYNDRHSHKKFDWDGRNTPESEADLFQIECGMMAATGDSRAAPPIRYRKPATPINTGRSVVETFSDLLFDEDRAPRVVVKDDTDWQKWYRDVIETADWIPFFHGARDVGGSTGSVFITLHFSKGKPILTWVDPRHCTAVRDVDGCIESLEIEYLYQSDEAVIERDREGNPFSAKGTVMRWYKREINRQSDVLYSNPEYEQGKAPKYSVVREIVHGIGRCPVVYCKNLDSDDVNEGVPDYFGAMELFDRIDYLYSQADRGTIYNVDPTLHIATNQDVNHVNTGSMDTIRTESGGTVALIELQGDGIRSAISLAEQLRVLALNICRCSIDAPQVNDRDRVTATEIGKSQLQMFARANRLRKSYGNMIVECLRLTADACSKYNGRKELNRETWKIEELELEEGFVPPTSKQPRIIKLRWGRYINLSPAELKTVVEALAAGRNALIMDLETAVEHLVEYFPYKDPEELIKVLQAEIDKKATDMQAAAEAKKTIPKPTA